MSRVQGFALALGSVGLVSAAQLGMRWSMTRLPQPNEWFTASIDLGALGVVVLAILAYALSMLCWLGALKHLPLGRAYSLLSISYAWCTCWRRAYRCSTKIFPFQKPWGWRLSSSVCWLSTLVVLALQVPGMPHENQCIW